MKEEDLQAIVREAVDRHLRNRGRSDRLGASPSPDVHRSAPVPARQHASHILLAIDRGSGVTGGACLIESAVLCSRCGYCQSYGH